MARELMEGSEAIARAMVAAGCRFFAGYPMTPFTEVLEDMAALLPEAGGVCINAESELEAIGMAWGAAATGARAATGSVGQGLSLMQESLAELCFARVPLVVLNMARGPGRLLPGHPRRRARRLPPHRARAQQTSPEAVELVQLAFHLADKWRNPGDGHGRLLPRPRPRGGGDRADRLRPAAGRRTGRSSGASTGTGRARIVSNVFPTKRNDHEPPMPYGEWLEPSSRRIAAMADEASQPLVETGYLEDAEPSSSPMARPAASCATWSASCARRACRSGSCGRSPCGRSRARLVRRRRGGRGPVVGLRAQRRPDDRRRPPRRAGRAGRVHRRHQLRPSGFGIAPELRVRKVTERIRRAMDRDRREEVVR